MSFYINIYSCLIKELSLHVSVHINYMLLFTFNPIKYPQDDVPEINISGTEFVRCHVLNFDILPRLLFAGKPTDLVKINVQD